jgi:hypothetical protein
MDRSEYDREYYIKNKDKVLAKNKKYSQDNKQSILDNKKKYYLLNRDKILQQKREYQASHRVSIRNRKRKYNETYYLIPNVRLSRLLRCRIKNAVDKQFGNKAYKSVELLGCSVDECRKWLESKFLPGMSWENSGDWHIDHIQPCASFDLTKPEEQLKCFHYTNLQPLWGEDNLSKSDKIQVLTSEGLFLV